MRKASWKHQIGTGAKEYIIYTSFLLLDTFNLNTIQLVDLVTNQLCFIFYIFVLFLFEVLKCGLK